MPDLPTLRGAARQLLDAAIAAGDAGRLTRAALERVGPRLVVAGSAIDLRPVRRVVIVGMGKASGTMARAAEDVLGDLPVGGLVVVKDLRGAMPRRVRAVEAGHPIPDARGQAAAEEILGLVQAATADDLVLCLVSGGGSALAPAPVPGVTLAEKQGVTRLLLAAGATTVTVRGPGRGGRCQEFALAVVEPVAGVDGVVVLAAGTDGSDGPTDAAGAIVDGTTLDRARRQGLSPQEALATNDSHGFFSRLGDLVVTGPTGTNLMDLYVGLVGPVPES